MTNEKGKKVMKKEYKDQEAYNYVASQINKTKINDVFKPIVIDIILRRRYEYQLDDKYFHRDVESFIRNVQDISVKKLPQDIGGQFNLRKKCISINVNRFKKNMNEQDMESVFKTICHECMHAMNEDETGNDRAFPRKEIVVDDAGTLFGVKATREAFTEKEADRIIYNRNIDDAFKYYNETGGYGDITKIVSAIAAAFGIKEKELLSAAVKGEQELYETLNSNLKDGKFPEEKFEDISFNMELAYYAAEKILKPEDNVDKKNVDNIFDSLKFIYRDLEQILAYRIEKLEWDNPEELQEKLEHIKLSQNAISNIIPRVIETDNEKVEEFAKPEKTKVYAKVMCMEEIIKSKNENSRELISFVQNSESVDEILEFMKKNGIEIDSEKLALMPEFELSQQKKDEWVKEFCLDGEEWDNTEIIKYMMATKEKVSFVDIIDKIEGINRKVANFLFAPVIIPARFLVRTGKNLWKALPKKEKPLLLDERKTRKNRRQKIVGII